jgi:hypothetical protein
MSIPAEFYDLNVWSTDPNELWLTAYEWELTPDGDYVQMNSSKYHSIKFNLPKDVAEIEFLLQDLYLNHYPLTDYDEWRNLEEVYNENAPESIRMFIQSLPQYEVPEIAIFGLEGANAN